jgi:hypothetical protein
MFMTQEMLAMYHQGGNPELCMVQGANPVPPRLGVGERYFGPAQGGGVNQLFSASMEE